MAKPDGGPAFPAWRDEDRRREWFIGMSLRDWFAGQALAALADCDGLSSAQIVEDCFRIADAMLAERAKE